jgi:flagellar biosynthesis protein FlhB
MTFDVIFQVAWKFGLFLVVVGLFDYAYERWQLEQNLKMTKQEVKDEWRQSEGNPEAKAALKRRQREFARRRMMHAVPRATVVVTNPTHFAVALEWDEIKMDAPVVTAKGADLVAKRIRDIAKEHNVPIMENPPLARTLYEKVDLDQPIPSNLYAAVAQVIAFVYKLKRKTIA